VVVASSTVGWAEPVIGTAVEVAKPFEHEDHPRIAASLSVLRTTEKWSQGLEVTGSYGGYTGGWECEQELEPGAIVPDVAVWCQRPILAVHGLAGRTLDLGPARARIEIGVGAAGLWTPLANDELSFSLHPSGLLRAAILFPIGQWGGGDWRTGLRAQEQVFGIREPMQTASLGWTLEATVVD